MNYHEPDILLARVQHQRHIWWIFYCSEWGAAVSLAAVSEYKYRSLFERTCRNTSHVSGFGRWFHWNAAWYQKLIHSNVTGTKPIANWQQCYWMYQQLNAFASACNHWLVSSTERHKKVTTWNIQSSPRPGTRATASFQLNYNSANC